MISPFFPGAHHRKLTKPCGAGRPALPLPVNHTAAVETSTDKRRHIHLVASANHRLRFSRLGRLTNHQLAMKGYRLFWLVPLWVCLCPHVDSMTTENIVGGADLLELNMSSPTAMTTEISKSTPTSLSLETPTGSQDGTSHSSNGHPVHDLIQNSTDDHVSSESESSGVRTTMGSFSATTISSNSSESDHSGEGRKAPDDQMPPSEASPAPIPMSTTSKQGDTRTTPPVTSASTGSGKKNPFLKYQLTIVILVVIGVLVILFFVMLFMLLRKKRRSGSQNFSKRSRNANGKDVWAGQVPELAEGNGAVENGTAASAAQAREEQEMTTFGEMRDDSVVEMEELVAGGTDKQSKKDSVTPEEEKPLLEEDFEGSMEGDKGAKEEQFLHPPPPPEEEDLAGNGGEITGMAKGDS